MTVLLCMVYLWFLFVCFFFLLCNNILNTLAYFRVLLFNACFLHMYSCNNDKNNSNNDNYTCNSGKIDRYLDPSLPSFQTSLHLDRPGKVDRVVR